MKKALLITLLLLSVACSVENDSYESAEPGRWAEPESYSVSIDNEAVDVTYYDAGSEVIHIIFEEEVITEDMRDESILVIPEEYDVEDFEQFLVRRGYGLEDVVNI